MEIGPLLSFHYVGPRYQIQVFRPGGRLLYPLSQRASPILKQLVPSLLFIAVEANMVEEMKVAFQSQPLLPGTETCVFCSTVATADKMTVWDRKLKVEILLFQQ